MNTLNPTNSFGFHKLPMCLLEHKDLKITEIVLYSVMLSRYSMLTAEGRTYFDTYEQLAEHSKMSRATVASALKVLRELGLVEIDKKVKAKNNLFNKNVWKVNSVFPDKEGALPSKVRRVKLVSDNVVETMTEDFIASNSFLGTSVWRQLRMTVLEHYGSQCMCCGAIPGGDIVMNVDHIKPRKTHPHLALEFDNLQVLCNVCNHGKGNWSTADLRPKKPKPL